MRSRRLLLISYHFPPSNEVAGKVTARLVRYLPKFGWRATVLTIPAEDPRVVLDPTAYFDVLATTPVERVGRGFHPHDLVALAGRAWNRCTTNRRGRVSEATQGATADAVRGKVGDRIRWLYATVLQVLAQPDPQGGWVLPAYFRARQLMKAERFDAVMTVSPPESAHLIGLLLRRWCRVPWVAQFHDPWVENPFHVPLLRIVDRSTRYLERAVVRAADLVLGATDECTARFVERWRDQPRAKFDTLYTGFDQADFPTFSSAAIEDSDGPIRMCYTGTLYGERNPFPLLKALAGLVACGKVGKGDVEIRFIGGYGRAMGRSVADVASELGIAELVKVQPAVAYPDALAALARSHVLLLFAQNQPAQVPAKLYEYLCVNRYILGFTSGASARIIRDLGAGQVVASDSAEEATAALENVLSLHRQKQLMPHRVPDDLLQNFTAQQLASFLAKQLDRLAGVSQGNELASDVALQQFS